MKATYIPLTAGALIMFSSLLVLGADIYYGQSLLNFYLTL